MILTLKVVSPLGLSLIFLSFGGLSPKGLTTIILRDRGIRGRGGLYNPRLPFKTVLATFTAHGS